LLSSLVFGSWPWYMSKACEESIRINRNHAIVCNCRVGSFPFFRSRPWKVSYANGDTYEGEAMHLAILSQCHSGSFQLAQMISMWCVQKVGTPLDSAQSMDFTADFFDPEGNRTHTCAVLAPRLRRVHLQWRRA
jgi:hypothetical protein